jgi:hypothetical protein
MGLATLVDTWLDIEGPAQDAVMFGVVALMG